MSHIHLDLQPTAPARPLSALPGSAQQAVRKLVATIFTWTERARMRRRLLSLDDRMLRDLGITRAEVHTETAKPFWRV